MYDRSMTDWSLNVNAVHIVYHMMLFPLCFDMCHSNAYLSPTKFNIAHLSSRGAFTDSVSGGMTTFCFLARQVDTGDFKIHAHLNYYQDGLYRFSGPDM
ncbi:hypothetical protein CY34DRAFT_801344 [Suillus luteus UH-Slu-Lm8-n1]|uniref:Unplaced genomic scaffold CY34scaffold_39, whole genome shotgun sequence n=1 Tax=Suillus luteus UH-Slu-Lm8-n1 TaxID=930992 RepID=A0A0D0AVA1_9AGAM|nr:hypothetical protein CY34DRAFT_801344 [Suillus luteus UH-Slu-Lm8-n1]